MATSAPSATKRRAVARPMPLLPPVMRAFFPASFIFSSFGESAKCGSVRSVSRAQPFSGRAKLLPCSVPGFDGLDAAYKRLFQNAPANRAEHEAEHLSLKVLALAYDVEVNISCAVGMTREGVGVAGRATPQVGVGGCEDDMVRIGPVIVQA